MEIKITIFTIFTLLLFTYSSARPTIDPPQTIPSTVKTEHVSTESNIVLPGQNIKSNSNETTNRLTPHTNFSRFHPINRHFNDKPHRRPCRKHSQYRIPRNEMSNFRYDNSNAKNSPAEVRSNYLKMNNHYDSPHHRSHSNNRNKNEHVFKTKNVINRDKLESLIRERGQKKKRDEEALLMKSIRKFLKHTFD